MDVYQQVFPIRLKVGLFSYDPMTQEKSWFHFFNKEYNI